MTKRRVTQFNCPQIKTKVAKVEGFPCFKVNVHKFLFKNMSINDLKEEGGAVESRLIVATVALLNVGNVGDADDT